MASRHVGGLKPRTVPWQQYDDQPRPLRDTDLTQSHVSASIRHRQETSSSGNCRPQSSAHVPMLSTFLLDSCSSVMTCTPWTHKLLRTRMPTHSQAGRVRGTRPIGRICAKWQPDKAACCIPSLFRAAAPKLLQLCWAAGALFRGMAPVPPVRRSPRPPPGRRGPAAGMLGHCEPPSAPAVLGALPAGHDFRANRHGKAPLRWPGPPTLQTTSAHVSACPAASPSIGCNRVDSFIPK